MAVPEQTIALSITSDRSFQAIAQGPDEIVVYCRRTQLNSPLLLNGACVGCFEPCAGKPFSCMTLHNLKPDTTYHFSLGQDDPTICEKTPCALPRKACYDVLIIGGTASGIAAAVTAARLGLRVAIIEETNRLGGMVSNGLASTDIRMVSRSNGIFEEFRQRVRQFYGGGDGLRYESNVANAIVKAMVYKHDNISVFLKCVATKPIMQGNKVAGSVVRDQRCNATGNLLACVTIDATDTGDFAAQAGAPYVYGREPRTPNEPHAGVIYFDDAKQKILPGSTGCGDCKQQSYAYLMIWKDYGKNKAPLIEEPPYYDPESYRYSPDWEKTWNYTSGKLPNKKYEINQHPWGIDWPGINQNYPVAGPARRHKIADMYKARALGYLYFMQNERGHTNLGLADDEFLDNENFPVSLYVREARRIVGEYVMAENDVTYARDFARVDSIGIGDYPMDSHAVEGPTNPYGLDKGEGECWLASFTPWYQIPYGVLIPKGTDGILVSTTVSATHIGYGTLRMEPVRMSMGQAAGAAAYWSILYGKTLRDVRPAWIQDKILSQGAYIAWNSDVDRNTRHFKAINFLAAQGVFTGEAFRPEDALTKKEAFDAINLMLQLEGCSTRLPINSSDSKEPITRGQFAEWLVRAKQMTSKCWGWSAPKCASYHDVPASSPYYLAVETLKAHRIIGSLFADTPANLFKPCDPISRADSAEAIYLAHRARAMGYWLP